MLRFSLNQFVLTIFVSTSADDQQTWQDDIVHGGDTEQARAFVYRENCHAGNMSAKTFHPDLKMKAATRGYTRERHTTVPKHPFRFNNLDNSIQAKIFKLWLKKEGSLQRGSRMCQYGQVAINRLAVDGYPRRFYWGQGYCSIRTAHRHNDVLNVLLVSKAFCHRGVHAFYSLNQCAFSSFGETERFLMGIGTARRQRIQSINLCFIGACMPRKIDPQNPKRQFASTRTRSLHVLPQLKMLRRITTYIDEGITRMRRPYEEIEVRKILEVASGHHENTRLHRSLRTLQGLDYWIQFRGIHRVILRELSSHDTKGDIRDTSSARDFKSQVMQPKRPEDVEARASR